MSSCLRSIPNKFTSFVNTRRQVSNIDHQLTKHVKSLLFLDEFLDAQIRNSTTKSKVKSLNSIIPLLNQNTPVTVVHSTSNKRPKSLSKKYNLTKHHIDKIHQQRQMNVQVLRVINLDLANANLSRNSTQWGKTLISLQNKKSNSSQLAVVPTKRLLNNALLNSTKKNILYTDISPSVQNEMPASEDRKPSETQLQSIFNVLQEDLPLMFVKQMNYSIYTSDLVFVNNIKGTTTVGIFPYVKQLSILKIVGHLKFAYIKLNILKMTMHPEDNSIKVRWRIVGISGTRIFLTFWKFKIWDVKEQLDGSSTWYDGFSTFYVNNDGKIFKHVVDKLMPDQDVEAKVKTPIDTKLTLFTALLGLDSHWFIKLCLKKCPELFRIK